MTGQGYEWPEREHGIHIDYKGFVWLGGNSCPTNGLPGLKPVADDQLLKFTQDGKFVMQIGQSNQSKGNADTQNLHRPADVWVDPPTNELFVADGYGNHRVAVFDADSGAFKRMWGAFGNKPADDDHCEVVTHKDFSNPARRNSASCTPSASPRTARSMSPTARTGACRCLTRDGKFIKQLMKTDAIFARDLALSPDPQPAVSLCRRRQGHRHGRSQDAGDVGKIQPPGILGAGHHIQTDSKGNIYIAQTTAGMRRLLYKGMSVASR